MGGLDSPGFARFKQLFKEGFEAARKHSDSILSTHRSGSNTVFSSNLVSPIFSQRLLS